MELRVQVASAEEEEVTVVVDRLSGTGAGVKQLDVTAAMAHATTARHRALETVV